MAPQTRSLHASAPPGWTPGPRARASVATALGDRYGVWNEPMKAWCTPQSTDEGWTCTTIADVQFVLIGGRRRALLTAAGTLVSSNGRRDDCHACAATLGLFVLEPAPNDGWRVVSALDQVGAGGWGGAGDVRVVSLGPAVAGWAVEQEDGGQGYVDRSLDLYAAVGPTVHRVLEAQTGQDNTGSDDPGGKILTTVTSDRRSAYGGFYRLRAVTETSRLRHDRLRRVSTKTLSLDYNPATGQYPGIVHDSRTIDPPPAEERHPGACACRRQPRRRSRQWRSSGV